MRHARFLVLPLLAAPWLAAATVDDDAGRSWGWTPVQRGAAGRGLHVTGQVIPEDGALYIESARVAGRVTGILKREGEAVRPHDPLYAVSSADCLQIATEKRTAIRRGLPELLAAARRREAQLGIGTQAGDCIVLADHAGVLVKRTLESGAAFNPGDALATVVDTSRLVVELDVPERNIPSVKAGQCTRVQVASSPKGEQQTTVQYVVPAIDPTSRTGKARLHAFPLPPGTTLAGLVFADIDTGGDEALLEVPSTALVFSHGKRHVVKRVGGKAVIVPVQVVDETDRVSLVRSAEGTPLAVGDEVAGKDAIFLFQSLGGGD